jgi:hypothetical protein
MYILLNTGEQYKSSQCDVEMVLRVLLHFALDNVEVSGRDEALFLLNLCPEPGSVYSANILFLKM